jgi:hypothetical protein
LIDEMAGIPFRLRNSMKAPSFVNFECSIINP